MFDDSLAASQASVSDLLTHFAQERGVSQSQLSRQAGISKTTIFRWMNGRSSHPYYRAGLLKIAVALGLRRRQTNRLLRAAGYPPIKALRSSSDPDELELLTHWSVEIRTNLPTELSSFVGREEEISQVSDLVSRDQVRLVTLTGTGGSGKTRLALRVARELLDGYEDGVFWVPLGAIVDPALVVPQIATAVGLRDVVDSALHARLTRWFRSRNVLLVIDNLEQILDCGPTLTALLEHAPGLTILATSRVPLHVSGEHEWPVPPLAIESTPESLGALRSSPAISLFISRAEAANSRRVLGEQHLPTIAEICRRLDGLPLAIELAAARTRERDPAGILIDFPSRLDLAGDGPRDAPGRQQTLRDTIAWSLTLLPEAERQLLLGLSVFVGGWTEKAAEFVCLPDGSPDRSVPNLLRALFDANLIEAVPTPAGERRYRMLETIREFGLEQLSEIGEERALRERHARYYLRLAESAPPYLPESRPVGWFEQVDTDLENVRSALQWANESESLALVARFCAALWPYWFEYLQAADGQRWLDQVLPHRNELAAVTRAAVLSGACLLASSRTDFHVSNKCAMEALELWRELDEPREQAIVLRQLGWNEYMSGVNAAETATTAVERFQSALQAWQKAQDPHGIARGYKDLGFAYCLLEELDVAEQYFRKAEEIYRSLCDEHGTAHLMRDRGLHALLRGDLAEAMSLLEEAIGQLRPFRRDYQAIGSLFYLGTARCLSGDLNGALESYTEALTLHEEADDRAGIALDLLGLAAIAHRREEPARSAVLCGAASAVRQISHSGLPPAAEEIYRREIDLVIQQIGPDAFQQYFAQGAEMTLSEAIAFARAGIPAR